MVTSDGPVPRSSDCMSTATKKSWTISRPGLQKLCLISIKIQPICFYPALHIRDAHFKSVSICGRFQRMTPKVQLSVISIRMVLDIVC